MDVNKVYKHKTFEVFWQQLFESDELKIGVLWEEQSIHLRMTNEKLSHK